MHYYSHPNYRHSPEYLYYHSQQPLKDSELLDWNRNKTYVMEAIKGQHRSKRSGTAGYVKVIEPGGERYLAPECQSLNLEADESGRVRFTWGIKGKGSVDLADAILDDLDITGEHLGIVFPAFVELFESGIPKETKVSLSGARLSAWAIAARRLAGTEAAEYFSLSLAEVHGAVSTSLGRGA